MNTDHADTEQRQRLLSKCRSALAGGFGVLSSGERLAVALVLNRPDWLAECQYTVVEALQRISDTWDVADLAAVATQLSHEAAADAVAQEALARAALRPSPSTGTELFYSSTLLTYGQAPGYRDADLVFELEEIGAAAARPFRARIKVRREDGEEIVRHVLGVHRFAWRTERGPIDRQPNETRPRWIDTP